MTRLLTGQIFLDTIYERCDLNINTYSALDCGPIFIDDNYTLMDAITPLVEGSFGLVLIRNAELKLIGIFTEGDFRNAVLGLANLKDNIMEHANQSFIYLTDSDLWNAESLFIQNSISAIPVVKHGKLISLLTVTNNIHVGLNDELSAVVMAGGKGTRLKPFTNVLPKPLISYDEEPIIDKIIANFHKYGIDDTSIILYHRHKLISAYLTSRHGQSTPRILIENEPRGTIGGIKLAEKYLNKYVAIANCDILCDFEWPQFLNFHKKNNSDLSILGVAKTSKNPYGILKFNATGKLLGMEEKPVRYDVINSGIYIVNASCMKYIEENETLDMDKFIHRLTAAGKSVNVFPTNDINWIDIGQVNDFLKLI